MNYYVDAANDTDPNAYNDHTYENGALSIIVNDDDSSTYSVGDLSGSDVSEIRIVNNFFDDVPDNDVYSIEGTDAVDATDSLVADTYVVIPKDASTYVAKEVEKKGSAPNEYWEMVDSGVSFDITSTELGAISAAKQALSMPGEPRLLTLANDIAVKAGVTVKLQTWADMGMSGLNCRRSRRRLSALRRI